MSSRRVADDSQIRTTAFFDDGDYGPNHTKALVKSILEWPGARDWSLQGFGMLRTYLAPDLRLHVWDSRWKVENVTTMHTHPWNFISSVVAGGVKNRRYYKHGEVPAHVPVNSASLLYREQEILCGVGGHETETSDVVMLVAGHAEMITEGQHYHQLAHEIHSSEPVDGTVSIIQRQFLNDADHAFVYVPDGQEWVSAEPRPANKDEVEAICTYALNTWFKD